MNAVGRHILQDGLFEAMNVKLYVPAPPIEIHHIAAVSSVREQVERNGFLPAFELLGNEACAHDRIC